VKPVLQVQTNEAPPFVIVHVPLVQGLGVHEVAKN
jgi:hypothetical protein